MFYQSYHIVVRKVRQNIDLLPDVAELRRFTVNLELLVDLDGKHLLRICLEPSEMDGSVGALAQLSQQLIFAEEVVLRFVEGVGCCSG